MPKQLSIGRWLRFGLATTVLGAGIAVLAAASTENGFAPGPDPNNDGDQTAVAKRGTVGDDGELVIDRLDTWAETKGKGKISAAKGGGKGEFVPVGGGAHFSQHFPSAAFIASMQYASAIRAAQESLDAGRFVSARQTAEGVAISSLKGEAAYNLATIYAQLSGQPGASGNGDRDVATAISLLKTAAVTGYPQTEEEIEKVKKKDKKLASLRKRKEFKDWVRTLR